MRWGSKYALVIDFNSKHLTFCFSCGFCATSAYVFCFFMIFRCFMYWFFLYCISLHRVPECKFYDKRTLLPTPIEPLNRHFLLNRIYCTYWVFQQQNTYFEKKKKRKEKYFILLINFLLRV